MWKGVRPRPIYDFFSHLSLSLFLSLPLSFLLFHSPCSEGWEIYNVGDYVAFSFFAKNPVIPPFLHFLSPDFLFFFLFLSLSSTVHGKRPCRALMRGRNLLEANYSRPPLFRRVYRWNKFEKEGWSRGDFSQPTEKRDGRSLRAPPLIAIRLQWRW